MRFQDACGGYFVKGIFQEAEDWLGTAKRTWDWSAPEVASMAHKPEVCEPREAPLQGALDDCFFPDGSVSV
jgi:hypothetical protein